MNSNSSIEIEKGKWNESIQGNPKEENLERLSTTTLTNFTLTRYSLLKSDTKAAIVYLVGLYCFIDGG